MSENGVGAACAASPREVMLVRDDLTRDVVVGNESPGASVIDGETRLHQALVVAGITERDVLRILDNLANEIATLNAASVRAS